MIRHFTLSLTFVLCATVLLRSQDQARSTEPAAPKPSAADAATAWPSFRGVHAQGIAEGFATPVEWDVESGANVTWRQPIPGLAHSSPVVWGDRIFVTTAVKKGEAELKVGLYGSIGSVEDEGEHEFRVLCIDRDDGEVLWTRTAWQGVPAIKRHPKGSHAASTPATDGERVVAFFGSEGLYAYDFEGELLWQREFGVLDSGFYVVKDAQWGFASSPILHDGRVIVQCDVQGDSFIAALDAATGEEIWRTARDEVPTWSSPTVHVQDGRRQIVVNGYQHIGGYDFETGEETWRMKGGGGDIPVPTPVVVDGRVFITNAHGRMAPIVAISASASGELILNADDDDHVLWLHRRGGNYMQTPVVWGDEIYLCKDSGVLYCHDTETGERHYRQRLGTGKTGFTASGVLADGKLYFTSELGEVYIVRPGPMFELLGTNELGEECMASPAVSRGTLFFRTRRHLVALGLAQGGK